jgi:hypothetical protein
MNRHLSLLTQSFRRRSGGSSGQAVAYLNALFFSGTESQKESFRESVMLRSKRSMVGGLVSYHFVRAV